MQPLQLLAWHLPEDLDPQGLQHALADSFNFKSDTVKKSICRWFDTFDWRIFRSNHILTREGSDWVLKDLHGNERHRLRGGRKLFRFAGDFPDSPLREKLQQILSVRALIELGVAEIHTTRLHILNQDKKTVALLELQEIVDRQHERQLVTVRLQEIRGYDKWLKRITKHLKGLGIHKKIQPVDTLEFILEGSDRKLLDYTSGYNVTLEPEMKSRDAVIRIYRFLLAGIQKNEQGVINDIDSEFLHDLRVAVRRTRSALTLIKDVLDPDIEKHFKKEFKYIGGITGSVRDLDVYLLSRNTYSAQLPERLRNGLEYFFDDLANRRRQEQRKMVRAMRSARYRKILADWDKILSSDSELASGKYSNVPIIDLAGKSIHKRFRKVLHDGKKIHGHSPDEELHRLRIECKKLRYSLEFFSSLYDQEHMKQFIKQLKMLQDNLGDFNDLSVQQSMLADLLSRIKPGTVKSRELSASIGGLMTSLFLRHRKVRARFEQTFAHFSRKKNLELYHALFDR